jgi:hypothetical protein
VYVTVRLPESIHAPVAPLSAGLNRMIVPSDVNVNTFGNPGGRFGALGITTQEPTMLAVWAVADVPAIVSPSPNNEPKIDLAI